MKFWIAMAVLFAAFITSGVAGRNCGDEFERELMVTGETVLFWTLSVALLRRGLLRMKIRFHRRYPLLLP
jgi:hypothetical protein